MKRDALHRFVHRLLTNNPSFREHLTAVAPDGSRPIVIALRGDPVAEVLSEVEARGGAGNVIVPWLNGVLAVSMIREPDSGTVGEDRHSIAPKCTVGVFLARVLEDGGGTYEFALDRDGHVDAGSAEMVAIAS